MDGIVGGWVKRLCDPRVVEGVLAASQEEDRRSIRVQLLAEFADPLCSGRPVVRG